MYKRVERILNLPTKNILNIIPKKVNPHCIAKRIHLLFPSSTVRRYGVYEADINTYIAEWSSILNTFFAFPSSNK